MKFLLITFICLIALNLIVAEKLLLDIDKAIQDEHEEAQSQKSSISTLVDNIAKESKLHDKIDENDDDIDRQKKSYGNLKNHGDPVPLKVNPNDHVPQKPTNYGEQQNLGYGEGKPLKLGLKEPSISQLDYGEQIPLLPNYGEHLIPQPYKPPTPTQKYKPAQVHKNLNLYQPQSYQSYSPSDYGYDQPLNLYDSPQLLYDQPHSQTYYPHKTGYNPTKYAPPKQVEYGSVKPQYSPVKPDYSPDQYAPAKPQYAPVKTEYGQHYSGYAQSSPGYAPAKPYGQSKPSYPSHNYGYTQTKPTYGLSKPAYSDPYSGYNQPQTLYGGSYQSPYSSHQSQYGTHQSQYGSTHSDYSRIQSPYNQAQPLAYASHNVEVYSHPGESSNNLQTANVGCTPVVEVKQCQAGTGGYGSGYSVGGYGYGGSY